jgi:zinc transporter, ZIP family
VIGAALWALLAASSLVIGAIAAEELHPRARVVGATMGFGAGALVAAVAYELVPNERVSSFWIWFWFGGGALVFYVLDGMLERRAQHGSSAGEAIALGALLDGIPESMVLGISVAVGGSVSVGFLVAVFVSNIPESLASTAEMRATHDARWVYRLWSTIAVVSAIAAGLGYAGAKAMSSLDGRYIQAASGGAVLTMLTDTMMPQAFEKGGRAVALLTALGFAIAAWLTIFD